LASFLFLLVVGGLRAGIRTEDEHSLYSCFKIGNGGLSVSHLRYVEDTIFLGDAYVWNLWTLKSIIRCFKLASCLKVNFAKCNVTRVNVSDEFLGIGECFLHWRVGSLPLIYLGLPLGANLYHGKTLRPILDIISWRLNLWENKYFSLGGRLCWTKMDFE